MTYIFNDRFPPINLHIIILAKALLYIINQERRKGSCIKWVFLFLVAHAHGKIDKNFADIRTLFFLQRKLIFVLLAQIQTVQNFLVGMSIVYVLLMVIEKYREFWLNHEFSNRKDNNSTFFLLTQ